MSGRLITSQACVDEGAAWLSAADPALGRVIAAVGPLPLRRRPDGFAALLHTIVAQQLSVAAAEAIWQRIRTAGLDRPEALAAAPDEALAAAGLSRPKIRYARALAGARLDYDALRTAPDEAVIATLTQVPGIGRWSAEIYAMFALGRADVFAAGDLALREAARLMLVAEAPPNAAGAIARPSEAALREMAAAWSPWRAVAARALWAYYRLANSREGIS